MLALIGEQALCAFGLGGCIEIELSRARPAAFVLGQLPP